jgi:hypothetical protein
MHHVAAHVYRLAILVETVPVTRLQDDALAEWVYVCS